MPSPDSLCQLPALCVRAPVPLPSQIVSTGVSYQAIASASPGSQFAHLAFVLAVPPVPSISGFLPPLQQHDPIVSQPPHFPWLTNQIQPLMLPPDLEPPPFPHHRPVSLHLPCLSPTQCPIQLPRFPLMHIGFARSLHRKSPVVLRVQRGTFSKSHDSILLPSLSGALGIAIAVRCRSNERQIALALQLYCGDLGAYPTLNREIPPIQVPAIAAAVKDPHEPIS